MRKQGRNGSICATTINILQKTHPPTSQLDDAATAATGVAVTVTVNRRDIVKILS